MQIFRHFTANDVQLEAFPFKRELSMEAYLVENEGVLSLDSDTFSNVEIIETELSLKQGRKSKDTDGRIDILATYSQEYIAIVELKLGQLEKSHLEQLEDYLTTGKDQILKQYPDILDADIISSPKWIGVLIGSSIEAELASQLVNGYSTTSGIQIAALTIQRFRSKEGNVYITTDTYFGGKTSSKDTSKYLLNGVKLGKGRLVLEVIKQHITSNPNISYSELEKIFPKTCQGSSGVFATAEIANEKYSTSGRKRHFIEPQELIKLSDCTIAVSNRWGIKNIGKFIKRAKEIGISITIDNIKNGNT